MRNVVIHGRPNLPYSVDIYYLQHVKIKFKQCSELESDHSFQVIYPLWVFFYLVTLGLYYFANKLFNNRPP